MYFLFDNFTNLNFKYILALINSKLLNFYYFNKLLTNKKSIAQIKKEDLDQIPIYHLELNNKKDKQTHNKLVALVDQMLETQKLYHSAKLERDKKLYKQKIDIIDSKIDKLVYELYGLKNGEIKIVEEN